MIVKEDLLKRLRADFDLNIYEVKIWTALLCRGMATAGELSDISQIPRSRSYDVLDSLEKKGFVMMKLGKPIRYIAIDPHEIIRRVKDKIRNRSESKIVSLDKIKKDHIFTELELLYTQGIKKVDPSSLSGSLRGRSSIYSQLKGMIENAKQEVVIVTSEDGFFRKMKKFKNVFAKLDNKGIKIRVAAPLANVDPIALKDIKSNVNLKDVSKFDARFCVVDRTQVLFMVSNDKDIHENYDTGVWINTPFFSEAFASMFDTMWEKLPSVR
jgi:HTH-type transcriptional regulator, sugar sensing transcriptional regulator